MKISYLFVAILASNILGIVVGNRAGKTALLAVSGALALVGVVRLLG